MPPPPKLRIAPQDVDLDDDRRAAVHAIDNALRQSELGLYGTIPDEFITASAFMSRSPDHALRWICAQTTRAQLTKRMKHIYDSMAEHTDPDAANSEPAQSGEDAANESASELAGEPATTGTKRKRPPKEKTTREVNNALVKKLNLNLARTVASTQDWEHARAPEQLSNEERKYRDFAKKLPGVGVDTATQMITKAVAVGTMEVFRDWHTIMTVWKRQNQYGKKLFQSVAAPITASTAQGGFVLPDSSSRGDLGMVVLSQSGQLGERDASGLTAFETDKFRYLYFDAQKTEVDGLAGDMRHRWKMDQLYEEYTKLENEIKRRNIGTGARGVRYANQAKEHLFGKTYIADLGRLATKAQDPDLWTVFGQYLDWGKRWNLLKKQFGGVGIFGILPRSSISNLFVEKTLTQTRVAQWSEMIAACNVDVPAMVLQIEPLFLACMEESEPPPQFSFLEDLDQYASTTRPLALFESIETATASNSSYATSFYNAEDADSNADE